MSYSNLYKETSKAQVANSGNEVAALSIIRDSLEELPLTGGAVGAVATGIEKINEFYVAKQNLQDTVEAKKKYYEILNKTSPKIN